VLKYVIMQRAGTRLPARSQGESRLRRSPVPTRFLTSLSIDKIGDDVSSSSADLCEGPPSCDDIDSAVRKDWYNTPPQSQRGFTSCGRLRGSLPTNRGGSRSFDEY
jgi:hypothetical protein